MLGVLGACGLGRNRVRNRTIDNGGLYPLEAAMRWSGSASVGPQYSRRISRTKVVLGHITTDLSFRVRVRVRLTTTW